MSIGAGIFLFVIGAILAFALNIQVDWLDLDLVGYILMGAGFLIFIMGIFLLMRRRQTETVSRTSVDGTGGQVTRRSTSSSDDGTV